MFPKIGEPKYVQAVKELSTHGRERFTMGRKVPEEAGGRRRGFERR